MSGNLAEVFSRKTRVGGIGATPVERQVAADEPERQQLAEIFGLPAIAELKGDFTLSAPQAGSGIIDARLSLRAKVTQICVVSLEPFDTRVTENARLCFVPAASLHEDAEIGELDPERLDEPDEIPYAGDSIDLGAALAEQLALALDPYPRKPGIELPAMEEDPATHPFAALARRKVQKRE